MTKHFPLYLLVAFILTCFTTACNDDSDSSSVLEGDYYNCDVTAFSLAADDNVLDNLNSVFFSIDLMNARIFNADSLPKGTDVSHLIVNVSATASSKIEFTFKVPGTERDTTVNFTESPNDSINFTRPVTLTVTSYNTLSSRAYTITVNVHNELCDTLYWDRMAPVGFPKAAKAQKTVSLNSEPLTLLEGTDGAWYMCSTSDPYTYLWSVSTSPVPAGADINTFSATTDALYIAGADGTVYTSTDSGATWTATTARMDYIYGGYGAKLLGARHDSDGWKHVTYPASATEPAVPADCPVSGTSALINYETKWSSSLMCLMVGGIDASGVRTGETWAYDGETWFRISANGIDGRSGVTVFPYLTPVTTTASWKVTDESVLLAMGGIHEGESGLEASNTVYVSYDFGINWKVADAYLQFPEDFPGFYNAQAIVNNFTLPVSRVSAPVTSWECPYIYLYGGIRTDGSLMPEINRGVINRFTFKPLY